MFNNVTLIGYLGSGAESHIKRPSQNRATSEGQSQTIRRRRMVFGRTAEYALTLTKGAHLQIIGEIRIHELLAADGAKESMTETRVQRRFTRLDWTPTHKQPLLRIGRTS